MTKISQEQSLFLPFASVNFGALELKFRYFAGGWSKIFAILWVGGFIRSPCMIVYGGNSVGEWSKKCCNSGGRWSEKKIVDTPTTNF